MVNIKNILDAAQERIHDDSNKTRMRMLEWLQMVISTIEVERAWHCLIVRNPSVPVAGGVIDTPSDYKSIIGITDNSTYFLTTQHRLTPELAASALLSTGSHPIGFDEYQNSLRLLPAPDDGNITLFYVKGQDSYVDDATDTIWPNEFKPIMVRGVLDAYYEFDTDQRMIGSINLNITMLNNLKRWDNKFQPMPKYSRYMRS